MDNHPIPQDVTHFQFKLVGQLTIKQFGYLVAGGILTLICVLLPVNFFIKAPFVLLFAFSGVLFAFIPLEGRPADLMVSYFFKALFEPNQYIYAKMGNNIPYLKQSPITKDTTSSETNTIQPAATTTPFTKDTLLNMQLSQVSSQKNATSPFLPTSLPTQPINTIPSAPQSPSVPTSTPPLLEEPSQNPVQPPTQTDIATPVQPTLTPPMNPAQGTTSDETQKLSSLEEQLKETLEEKHRLQQQLASMQEQLVKAPEQAQKEISIPTPIAPKDTSPVVKTINTQQPQKSSLIAPDFPNIVMGVVKDARGNVLPNILIEVKDTNNNPVRAFKTNALGQFASATPLLNGTYVIVFEDPTKVHNFDSFEIAAKGEIMQPIEIISLDKREELRKELFG